MRETQQRRVSGRMDGWKREDCRRGPRLRLLRPFRRQRSLLQQRADGEAGAAADETGLLATARVVSGADGQFDGRGSEAQMLDIKGKGIR